MTITYPAGPVTPHGRYHLRKGDLPEVSLQSPNDQIIVRLMGGQAIPDPTRPESVQLDREGGLTGLIAPWETIDQEGATEDGVTFVDALYGPIEVTARVMVYGRDAKHTRRTVRHLFEALDVKQRSELGWMTHEMGYWWATVRWLKTPPDKYSGTLTEQQWTLMLRADSGFWQSYPDIDEFVFEYTDMTDSFNEADHTGDRNLGPNWPQRYDGDGGGFCYSDGERALWMDDPDDIFLTRSREVVNGPYKDFETEGNQQVINMVLGAVPEWSLPESGSNDLWGRMSRNVDGTWAGEGIRARVAINAVILTAFVDFEPVWTRTVLGLTPEHPLPIIPFIGDKWTLICGTDDDNPRLFRVLQNGGEHLAYKEIGTASRVGTAYRGIGFGMKAAGALLTQATPSTVRKISSGDNSAATQSGFLERNNAGDQDAYDELTFYGPGLFKVANGPGSTDFIEFGPLGVGEIAHIRTDPRKKNVFDYSDITGDPISPAMFGKNPSDTMYRKMKGRFTSECAIPAKEPGMRVQTHLVACSITGGNADSKIMAQLTPLRRYPQ